MDFKGPMTAERATAEVVARLHEIAAILGLANDLPAVHKEVSDGLVRVSLHATRCDPKHEHDESDWSTCDRDVFAVIAAASPRPLTRSRIVSELQARGAEWSDTSVKRSVGRLCDQGRIVPSRKAPRGYRLAGANDQPTLFDAAQ